MKKETKIEFSNGSTIIVYETIDAKVTRGWLSENIDYFWDLEEDENLCLGNYEQTADVLKR